jgi:Flp pilus assembly protein TadG
MTPSASARSDALACERGAAAVEFALIAPPLLTFIVGLIMLGFAYYQGATIQWSLERTLRAAMIDPDVSASDIEDAIRADLAQIGSPEIDFSYQTDETGAVPLAIVRVGYDVPLSVPFLPDLSLPFSAENVAPLPQD